ncbi:glycoside hydrolase family 5 protein [Gallaecimonas mangrovi]|uniref:glycoside hydrolase family 5 protein n=1 Tax=Gallaecimonas mangrovi TaxID=2291597 RepID=UPI000E1FD021|nr:cellulase family glycosylhydrolase [Gallaecimonas mangrovi]
MRALILFTFLALLSGCADQQPAPKMGWALPLSTKGASIVDNNGHSVVLKGVNWFGAESGEFVVGGLDKQPVGKIADLVKAGGFNVVRLPWSNELVERNPKVAAQYLTANPWLKGKSALAVLDAVVTALTERGIAVILDNHRSRGDWCCDGDHGDGLWHTPAYPEQKWMADWLTMAKRYQHNPLVVGYELRNEIRSDHQLKLKPSWGDGNASTDWRLAANKMGNALQQLNPKALIIVGGIDYQGNLNGLPQHPVTLNQPNKLVYAVHDYSSWHDADAYTSDAAFAKSIEPRFGFLFTAHYPVPVMVTEWGGCTQKDENGKACSQDRIQFPLMFAHYLNAHHLSWIWWPLNGTQSGGYNRHHGAVETYGILNPSWTGFANPKLMKVMQHTQ